jgi:hypothetical protein
MVDWNADLGCYITSDGTALDCDYEPITLTQADIDKLDQKWLSLMREVLENDRLMKAAAERNAQILCGIVSTS